MADFVVENGEDGKPHKVDIPTNLDAKTFVMGHGNIIEKMSSKISLIAQELWYVMIFLFLKEPKVISKLFLH